MKMLGTVFLSLSLSIWAMDQMEKEPTDINNGIMNYSLDSICEKRPLQELTQRNLILTSLTLTQDETAKYIGIGQDNFDYRLHPEQTFRVEINGGSEISLYPEEYIPEIFYVAKTQKDDNAKLRILYGNSESRIKSIALSPDKKTIAIGREDGIITIFDCESDTMYERNCSHDALWSIAFNPSGDTIIAMDQKDRLHLLNKKTNVLLHINNGAMGLKPNPDNFANQILEVTQCNPDYSPSFPLKFFNYNLTDAQFDVIQQVAIIKNDWWLNKKVPDTMALENIKTLLESANFEPPVKEKLVSIISLIDKENPQNQKGIISKIKDRVTSTFTSLQRWYTSYELDLIEPSTVDTV